jgi:hypothetical protein
MIKVVNKRLQHGLGEYIGRPSPLGNPFMIGRDGNRDEVITKYYNWLINILLFDLGNPAAKELTRLRGIYEDTGELTLVCWCAPQACHGDVIKHIIEES